MTGGLLLKNWKMMLKELIYRKGENDAYDDTGYPSAHKKSVLYRRQVIDIQ